MKLLKNKTHLALSSMFIKNGRKLEQVVWVFGGAGGWWFGVFSSFVVVFCLFGFGLGFLVGFGFFSLHGRTCF